MSKTNILGPKPAFERFRLSRELAGQFAARCNDLDRKKSEVLRKLIKRWLQQTAEISRLRVRQ